MSRRGGAQGKKAPGTEFTWDAEPGGEADTAPTPLYPVCLLPGLALQTVPFLVHRSLKCPARRSLIVSIIRNTLSPLLGS